MNKLILFVLIFAMAVFCSQSLAAQTPKLHHKDAGITCDDCHVTKPFEAATIDECVQCHELPEEKSEEEYHGAPDKHDSPHYGPELDCDNCHSEHGESKLYCNECHSFDFKVP